MKSKEVHVYFSDDAHVMYKELQSNALEQRKKGLENSSEIQLLKSIDREISNLKIDPQKGKHIPRRNIPKQAVMRYKTDKLWKLDLVGFWRMIYTITGDQVKIITFILEIMDHDKYNKLFGYRKK